MGKIGGNFTATFCVLMWSFTATLDRLKVVPISQLHDKSKKSHVKMYNIPINGKIFYNHVRVM